MVGMLEDIKSVETPAELEREFSATDKPVAVIFYASWSEDCRQVASFLAELAGHYRNAIAYVKVNVDQSPDIEHRYSVHHIPTILVIRGGKELGRLVNEKDPGKYVKAFNSVAPPAHGP